MVSIGPSTQSYNFTHMFSINDLRGHLSKEVETITSLMSIISKHPDFSKFYYMVKLAKLEGIFNSTQADFTIFVPSDKAITGLGEEVFMNMDDSVARHIIKSSTLNRKISSDLLEDSPASYFITNDPPNRLFITNISGRTYINNDINIIHKDMHASNGLIHVVDKLIWPNMV